MININIIYLYRVFVCSLCSVPSIYKNISSQSWEHVSLVLQLSIWCIEWCLWHRMCLIKVSDWINSLTSKILFFSDAFNETFPQHHHFICDHLYGMMSKWCVLIFAHHRNETFPTWQRIMGRKIGRINIVSS